LIADEQPLYLLALLATGIVVGFASGLLGVGGGFIMVPVQIWALTSLGIDPTIATRVALGTSLAVILPTALSGCHGHYCQGFVNWRSGIILGFSGLIGAMLGGTLAAHAPAYLLQKLFGIVVLAGALRMLLFSSTSAARRKISSRESVAKDVLLGFAVGVISGLTGIGGGVILVPAMVIAMNFDIRQSVGTSSIAIAIISIGGIISYAINGMGIDGRPPYSLGYVNLLLWAILAGTSIPMAHIGARFSHQVPVGQLTNAFIALMLCIGLKMIGAIDWFYSRL